MDAIQKILPFVTEYLADYFNVFILTLSRPSIFFPPIKREGKSSEIILLDNQKSWRYQLNPKLFQFAVISIFLGLTLYAITPSHTSKPNLIFAVVFNLSIWFIYSGVTHLIARIFHGKGSFIETTSFSLQIFSVIYVVCNLLALIDGVIVLGWLTDFTTTNRFPFLLEPLIVSAIFKFILLIIFIPIIIRANYSFHKVSLVLSTLIVLGCISVFTVSGIRLYNLGYFQELGNIAAGLAGVSPTRTPHLFVTPGLTATPMQISIPLPSGHIAFISSRSGEKKLYLMNANGTNQTLLVQGDSEDSLPRWSPDGALIAYVSTVNQNTDIYVIDLSTNKVRRITTDPARESSPSWSPDGKRIAFESLQSGISQIYVVNIDGSGLVRLTNDLAGGMSPAWSSTRNSIVFISNGESINAALYLVSPDGSGLIRLISETHPDSNPVWSPDGSMIAFRSFTSPSIANICIVDSDGSNYRCITDSQWVNGVPAWSPNGMQIAVRSERGGMSRIDLIGVKDGVIKSLALNLNIKGDPVWSPDGYRLVFPGCAPTAANQDCAPNASIQIYSLIIATHEVAQLTNSFGYNGDPAWTIR